MATVTTGLSAQLIASGSNPSNLIMYGFAGGNLVALIQYGSSVSSVNVASFGNIICTLGTDSGGWYVYKLVPSVNNL